MRTLLGASALLCTLLPLALAPGGAQELPYYLRDRGPGMPTSMFGTYVRQGERLLYPFFEWYADRNLEYKPSELGYSGDTDYRGRYRANEGLLWVSYGLGRNWAIELEAAYIGAELQKAADDPSAMPGEVEETGLGDVEGQLRWRFQEETARRPELFTYFETVFPLQRQRRLIGTSAWEHKLGIGLTRGFRWGTMTFRTSVEYSREEGKIDAGEYAIEYLKRLSPSVRVVAAIEGNQLDEVALITELQWHIAPRVFFKFNHGLGLTTNATDFAPEIGVIFSF
jgi:hypothetical protein